MRAGITVFATAALVAPFAPATAHATTAAQTGVFSAVFQNPKGNNCERAFNPQPRCNPAANAIAELADGRDVYWSGLEGINHVGNKDTLVTQFGSSAQNSLAGILDLRSGTAKFSETKQPDSGINKNGNPDNEYLPGPLHNNDVTDNDGDLFCADLNFLADGRVITNGGTVNMGQWSSQSFGFPGSGSHVPGAENYGILNLADNTSHLVVNGNQTGNFNILVTNGQWRAYGGAGTITYSYNPGLNVSTVSAVAPVDPFTPIFSLQPSNTIVGLGAPATLHALVSNVSVNYGWLLNNVPVTDGGGVSGSHTATLTVANFNAAETGIYSVVATNSNAVSQNDRSFASSQGVSVTAESFTLYPVVTVNGVNGNTYVVQYTTSLTPPVTWTPFSTNTVGAGPLYVVDTNSPLSLKKFYQVIQTLP